MKSVHPTAQNSSCLVEEQQCRPAAWLHTPSFSKSDRLVLSFSSRVSLISTKVSSLINHVSFPRVNVIHHISNMSLSSSSWQRHYYQWSLLVWFLLSVKTNVYMCCLKSRTFPLLPPPLLSRASHLHSREPQALYRERWNERLRDE